MKSEVRKMLVTNKRISRELDEMGGPGENGELFETVILLEDEILEAMELPPAQKFQSLLWEDDIDDIIISLENAREEYRERPIKDPVLLLVDAVLNRKDDPFNILPMAGFTVHDYQLFLFRIKLLCSSSPEEADDLIAEMKKAELNLNDLGILGATGIKKNTYLYRKLREAGMENLDEYLMRNGTFDLKDDEMGPMQHYIRGLINMENKLFNEAVRDLTAAASFMEDFPEVYYHRALALQNLGLFKEALDDYSLAIHCFPDHYSSLCNRGLLLVKKGLLDQALDDFNQAIAVRPQFHVAYCNRGNLYALREEFDRAVDDFNRAIVLGPGESSLYCNRGITYFRLGRKDVAKDDLVKSAGMGDEKAREALLDLFGVK